jgi:Toprim domain
MVAALSAAHLGALILPPGLKRLFVSRDADAAGRWAFERLARRAHAAGIKVVPLDPVAGDFNDDLRAYGATAMRAAVLGQM